MGDRVVRTAPKSGLAFVPTIALLHHDWPTPWLQQMSCRQQMPLAPRSANSWQLPTESNCCYSQRKAAAAPQHSRQGRGTATPPADDNNRRTKQGCACIDVCDQPYGDSYKQHVAH